jgi:hypothetical protein
VGDVFAAHFYEASDARYKTNVQPLPDALEPILNLRGVRFDWNQSAFSEKAFSEGRQVGFLAQEVEKVLPARTQT